MRVVGILAFICIPLTVNAQVILERDTINSNGYTLFCSVDQSHIAMVQNGNFNSLSYDNYFDPSRPGDLALPTYDVFIAIAPTEKPEVEFISTEEVTYEAVPQLNPNVTRKSSELVLENLTVLKKSRNQNKIIKKDYAWIGNNYCVHLKLNLFGIRTDATGILLTKKFTLKLKYSSKQFAKAARTSTDVNPLILNHRYAKNYQSKPNIALPNSDSWIDYNSEYLKLGVNQGGVYRIYTEDLQNTGINFSGIDPRSYKLILRGIEIPIYVKGEEDGKLDQDDFIEFAGQKNMGADYREISVKGEPYKEYVNRYSDTTVYWLTWNGKNGLRVNTKDNSVIVPTDTLKYYSELIHIEKNNWFDFSMTDAVLREMPFWSENKTWNDGNLNVGTRSINFSLKDIYPNKSVKVFAKLQDYASNLIQNAHLLAISLNNSAKQDSGYVNRYEQKVLQGNYNSNILKEGTNTLNLHSFETGAYPNVCILDWYEMEYPRYLYTINDSLNFQFPFITDVSSKAFKVSNLDQNKKYTLWKVGKDYSKYKINWAMNELVVADTILSSDKFMLVDSSKTLRPKFYYKKSFVNLRNESNTADYITITHKKFLKGTEEYTAFISQTYNLRTKVIDVDDIYDEFAYGFFMPEAIRDFLIVTNTKWQNPNPKNVLLIGGATYDYLGNKNKFQGAPVISNYVPSFGSPVSDNWFVIWDSTETYIPQINIGRLPVTKNEELNWYLQKHREYVSQKNSSWNKRYLFFSGGNSSDESQIQQMKATNDFIINNYVEPAPIGGNYFHFYKTINPTTDFGPYTPKQFQTAVDSGGIFISYLGHSGTQMWDNSIIDPGQLANKVDRYPLITDFGCATAKFAEPDVISFSQLFVNDPSGQAIAYIGNTSLGFTSSTYSFPQYFYKKVLYDSVYTIGDAHRLAKMEYINNYGANGVYKLISLSNTLIGDPVVKLPIPDKINLSITAKDIKYNSSAVTDSDDSLHVKIKYFNYGIVRQDTFKVEVNSFYNKVNSLKKIILKNIPRFDDSITVAIPIKNKPGEHTIQIILDSEQRIRELSKNDNTVEVKLLVASSSIKLPQKYHVESKLINPISLLNPVSDPYSKTFQVDIASNPNFSNSDKLIISFDTLKTLVNIPTQYNGKRIWMRSRINESSEYGNVVSFLVGSVDNYSLSDSIGLSTAALTNLKIKNQSITLDNKTTGVEVLSAGFNDGRTALIQINGENFIPENTLRGHHVVLLEDSTYKFIKYKNFDVHGNSTATQEYLTFLDSVTSKYIAIFTISDEGSLSSSALRNKLKEFGSKYIDKLVFRGSWAMIGKKGAVPGSVQEVVSNPYEGRVQIDTTFISRYQSGSFCTTRIGPAAKWKSIELDEKLPAGSALTYKLIGIKKDESVDTLNVTAPINGTIDLSSMNGQTYPYIRIEGNILAPVKIESPTIKNLEVNYNSVPELALNYQTVWLNKDTLTQGESANLAFYIYNTGKTSAANFKVKVVLVKPDNSREQIFEQAIDSIAAAQRKLLNVNLNSILFIGNGNIIITVDPENSVLELYKDNNVFALPFYSKQNNTPTTVNLSFDGKDIINGDFISATPDIRIELHDYTTVAPGDTSLVQMYLNGKRVYFNNRALNYSFSNTNPKVVVNFKPQLADGNYSLKILAKNAQGQIADTSGTIRKFSVSNRAQLLNVYNYPNPVSGETYFTFKLTIIPDRLSIKIFTVAGRMIKNIEINPSSLNLDFNRILWDGRDEDGNLVANGVYFYKIILQKGSDALSEIQKLVIMR